MYQKIKEKQLNKEVLSKLNFVEDNIRKTLEGIEMIKHVYLDKIITKSDWEPKIKSLKGLWSNVRVDQKDFRAAEKSLFPYESS